MHICSIFVYKIRAAQSRHLVPCLLGAFKRHYDKKVTAQRWMLMALERSAEFDEILDVHADEYKLPGDAAARLLEVTREYLQLVSALRNHFGSRLQLFHVTAKSHYLIHVAMLAKYMNPRLCWCYSGEDFVGRIKQVIASCQHGTPPRLVVARAITK